MARSLASLALSLLVLFPAAVAAQEAAATPPSDKELDPAIEKKVNDLVDSLSEQVGNLHTPINRIRFECAIADLIWNRDEKRARAAYKSATQEIIARIADIDLSDPQVNQELNWLNQLRQEIVNQIADHDPEFALTFLRDTRFKTPDDPRYQQSDTEASLELQLAQRLAASDPARALSLARSSLNRGQWWNLTPLLMQLQRKDPKSALTLYQAIVTHVKDDVERNQQSATSAWSLLSSFQPPQADADTYRDLMTALVNATLNISPGSQSSWNFLNQLNATLPQIEKYAPERLVAVRQWIESVDRLADPNQRMYQEMSRIAQKGSVEDMLAAAPRYPKEFQISLYQQAAWKAFQGGDAARARQIVNDFVTDPVQRRQMLDQFENQSLYTAVNQNKPDSARQLVNSIKNIAQRVQMASRLATQMAAKGDKKGALDLLDELRSSLASLPNNSSLMFSKILLARSYAPLDLDQSFSLIQPILAKSNELVTAAAVLDGFEQRYLRDGEWTSEGGGNLGNLIVNLQQTLATLSHLDFDRARALADQFDRPEIRLMTQLQIAQSVLKKKNDQRLGVLPPNAVFISR
jgi:siroheme synthase (precorrin-2 oxidase/ferrochelatase)